MKRNLFTALLMVAFIIALPAYAADAPKDPKKQTSWGLYVDAKEAAEMKQNLGNKMLFVDVRDPVEIMFTGYTDVIDANIPFKLVDRSQWHKKKPVYQLQVNPNFEKDIATALKARGLSKADPVVLMCRSGGTRGAPATKLLEGKGYKQVYVVTDGFEGGTVKDGEKKNWRLKNGWKNAGLPWSYKLNKDKMYFSDAEKNTVVASADDKKASFMPKAQHATPMPNYMRTIRQNADILKLSTEQKSQLQKWVDQNNKAATDTINRIVSLENEIAVSSLYGASKEVLMAKNNELIDLRKKLAVGKTNCRDNARSILTTEQWNKLVELEVRKSQQTSS